MTSKAKPTIHPKLTELPNPPEEDRIQQYPHFTRAAVILNAYFRHALGRNDVLVNGDGYLCRRASEARRSPRPDVLVAVGLPFDPEFIAEANGYTIEEIGQPPDFVLEVASSTTGRRDYTVKRDTYAGLEVKEYWRFDHTGGRYHDAALAGDALVDGRYEPIHVEEGDDGIHRGYSEALGLELHWAERQLRFFDRSSGTYLPDMEESWAQRDAAQAQLQQAESGRLQEAQARRRAEAERDEALNRARELEEELRQLRGQ